MAAYLDCQLQVLLQDPNGVGVFFLLFILSLFIIVYCAHGHFNFPPPPPKTLKLTTLTHSDVRGEERKKKKNEGPTSVQLSLLGHGPDWG